LGRAAQEELPAEQILRINLRIRRLVRSARRRPSGQQLDAESVDNCARDLVLHREDSGQLALEGSRPEVVAVDGADELSGDAYALAFLAHAPLQYMRDVQLAPDLGKLDVLSLEGERRGAADDVQAFDLA